MALGLVYSMLLLEMCLDPRIGAYLLLLLLAEVAALMAVPMIIAGFLWLKGYARLLWHRPNAGLRLPWQLGALYMALDSAAYCFVGAIFGLVSAACIVGALCVLNGYAMEETSLQNHTSIKVSHPARLEGRDSAADLQPLPSQETPAPPAPAPISPPSSGDPFVRLTCAGDSTQFESTAPNRFGPNHPSDCASYSLDDDCCRHFTLGDCLANIDFCNFAYCNKDVGVDEANGGLTAAMVCGECGQCAAPHSPPSPPLYNATITPEQLLSGHFGFDSVAGTPAPRLSRTAPRLSRLAPSRLLQAGSWAPLFFRPRSRRARCCCTLCSRCMQRSAPPGANSAAGCTFAR